MDTVAPTVVPRLPEPPPRFAKDLYSCRRRPEGCHFPPKPIDDDALVIWIRIGVEPCEVARLGLALELERGRHHT